MSTHTIAVVSAGLSRPSSTRLLADRLAAAAERRLGDEGHDVVVETFELRDHAQAITNDLLTGFPSEELRQVLDAVGGADAVIVVSPIFSASYSGLFKSFFDVLGPDSLVGKPVLVAATGGTARHSLALEFALRPLFAYLRATVAPTGVFAATEDWASAGEGSGLAARVDRAAGELVGLLLGSTAGAPVDAFEDVTPFERLLAGDA
jgi:FMN reductase